MAAEIDERLPFREQRLRSLEVAYAHLMSSGLRTVVVEGPPGSGKTTFALQFAHRFRKRFPGGIRVESGAGRPDEIFKRPTGSGSKLLIFDGLDECWPSQEYGLERITDAVQGDPKIRVLATARSMYRHHFDSFQLPLPTGTDIAELIAEAAGFDGWMPDQLVRLADNNVMLASLIGKLVRDHGDFERAARFLRPFAVSGLVRPDGSPLDARSKGGRRLIESVRHVDDQLMQMIHRNPELVYELHPRKFEEISAELFQRLGYEVTLTPASKDGGKDLIIVSNSVLGKIIVFAECKLYAKDRPVGVSIIDQLRGVIERGNATSGIVLTTSSFTRGARQAAEKFKFRMSLQDYVDFQLLLEQAMSQR
jgi:restriction system protein